MPNVTDKQWIEKQLGGNKTMTTEFLDLSSVDLNDTFEPEVLPDGEEVQLVITSMLIDQDKNGNRYIMPFFDVEGQPKVKDISKYMPIPRQDMAPKELNNAKLDITTFGEAFGIDFSGQLDIKNDVIGQKGWAILGRGKDKRDGSSINTVKKFTTGA